ncbi:MAG: hypothetical protein Q9220_005817 [cf. Caloplaca sp. 1 TL-2023]
MATRSKVMASPVGSTSWLGKENEQVAQFSAQEIEDFTFSVRNELDFLNEHMAEIFSKNHVNIAEVFKTPGKLRGKTPRTARKRNPLEVREPLNDIFAPKTKNAASPYRSPNRAKEQRHFEVAKDVALHHEAKQVKANNDSGYHGMTEDEMDVDEPIAATLQRPQNSEDKELPNGLGVPRRRQSREQSAMDVSFHSAKEELVEAEREIIVSPVASVVAPQAHPEQISKSEAAASPPVASPTKQGGQHITDIEAEDKASILDEDADNDALRSASEGSSPALKGVVRKSSLTFATLPAREPLTTKKSIGARLSRTSHVDASKGIMSRGSFLGRITGGKSMGTTRQPETALESFQDQQPGLDQSGISVRPNEMSSCGVKAAELHNKSSTQRLHDRINMLGKSQPGRPTKSIPAAPGLSQPSYPELPLETVAITTDPQFSKETEEDDDWIEPPLELTIASPRPPLSKSISADVMEDLRGKANISDREFGKSYQESISPMRRHSLSKGSGPGYTNVQSPDAPEPIEGSHAKRSTTPTGTPTSTRHVDGPLSASKSKLQSIMKTARGLFTSSAGASAQAKMELRNQARPASPSTQSPSVPLSHDVKVDLDPALESNRNKDIALKARPKNPAKPAEARKTRGSIEKEKKAKESQQAHRELGTHQEDNRQAIIPTQTTGDKNVARIEQAIALERHDEGTTAMSQQPPTSPPQPARRSPRRIQEKFDAVANPAINEEKAQDGMTTKPSQPQLKSRESQIQRPRDTKRPVKPAKEPASKPEPQRVAIRVGTLSQRIPLTNAALSSGLQDTLPPPVTKHPGLTKKTSTASIQTAASNNSLRSATTSKPKALIAAERKKEQDEREAQRKMDQKKENERRRVAQQEELRRQEQAQRLEAERQRERERVAAAEDPKKIAQRQAIEKRRQELAKKEQQRNAPDPQQQIPSSVRPELGGMRTVSKLQLVQDTSKPPIGCYAPNNTKPQVKRVFDPEADENVRQSRITAGQSYQANEAKRRRTNDEAFEEPSIRPTMAPPKRQSNLLKDTQRPYGPSLMGPPPSIANGYPHVKSSAADYPHQGQYQHQTQPVRPGQAPNMAKFANGRIVFAENTNAAHPPYKTPNQSRSMNQPLAKSSPQYTNGENIQLEDIPTDSDEDESEDDERSKKAKGALLPTWVQSPYLNDLLREQERSKDPDSIFGPSAAVNMEEMFKERHHRFRSRTSSANWAGNDRLTEDEIRNDNAAREKMRREGGWTFGL